MLPRRISVSLFIDQSIIWPVKRLQAFKFQLRPGGQQEREMRRFAGACRVCYDAKHMAKVAFWIHVIQFARPDQAVQ